MKTSDLTKQGQSAFEEQAVSISSATIDTEEMLPTGTSLILPTVEMQVTLANNSTVTYKIVGIQK